MLPCRSLGRWSGTKTQRHKDKDTNANTKTVVCGKGAVGVCLARPIIIVECHAGLLVGGQTTLQRQRHKDKDTKTKTPRQRHKDKYTKTKTPRQRHKDKGGPRVSRPIIIVENAAAGLLVGGQLGAMI